MTGRQGRERGAVAFAGCALMALVAGCSAPVAVPVSTAAQVPVAAVTTVAMTAAATRAPAVTVTRPGGRWAGHQVAVLRLSHTALRLTLHPGMRTNYSHVYDPGASTHWTMPPVLAPARPWQVGLAATFNGGFKLTNGDSHGGYWDTGYGINGSHSVVRDPSGARTLTKGAASLVIYRDGTWALGTWGHEVAMTPQVRFVRQELLPLVDRSTINPLTSSADCQLHWGITMNDSSSQWYQHHCDPWRSGVGITATGDLVYVSGHYLTPHDLAVLLRQAGAVRAMQLDINQQWISAMTYNSSAVPRGHSAVPHVVNSPYNTPTHYISGSASSGTAANRDFFAAYLR